MRDFRQTVAVRVGRVARGLDVGFADAAFSAGLRETCGGQWMTIVTDEPARAAVQAALPPGTVHRLGAESALPFQDCQFDVTVLNGALISLPLIREIHRVLKPSGRLFFELEETVRRGTDSTSAKIYNSFLRSGFNVASLVRPPWWRRMLPGGSRLMVCATRKNWRELKGFARR